MANLSLETNNTINKLTWNVLQTLNWHEITVFPSKLVSSLISGMPPLPSQVSFFSTDALTSLQLPIVSAMQTVCFLPVFVKTPYTEQRYHWMMHLSVDETAWGRRNVFVKIPEMPRVGKLVQVQALTLTVRTDITLNSGMFERHFKSLCDVTA